MFNDKLNKADFLTLSSYFAPDAWSQLRLYLLYFGFWAFSIGVILFQIYCPRQIKQHGALWEYVDREGPSIGSVQHENIRESVVMWLYGHELVHHNIEPRSAYEKLKDWLERKSPPQDFCAASGVRSEKETEDLLQKIYKKMDSYVSSSDGVTNMLTNYYEGILRYRFPRIRITIYSMYCIGIFAVGLPAIELLLRVSKSFARFGLRAVGL